MDLPPSSVRCLLRAALDPDVLLTLEEAGDLAPGRPDAARMWIAEHVPACGAVGAEPVYRWGDVVAAITSGATARAEKLGPAPITSWRGVARVLHLSEDTVARHRRRHGDRKREPWFADAAAITDWWTALHQPPALRRTGRS